MSIATPTAAVRPRDYVAARGPDAADFLDRMLSNDLSSAPCPALLLTPKGRVIAPLLVVKRGEDDFLLLTEEGLGEAVRSTLLRARFASKCELELEEHTSLVVFGGTDGIPTEEYGEPAVEVLDATPPTELLPGEELERRRIEARTPAWGREIDERILPAEAGLTETHVSFTKGCYPGQEPIARLHYRGKANRRLALLEVEGAPEPETPVTLNGKNVGRVTSSVPGLALAYVRTEVPDDAMLLVGDQHAKVRPARFERATSASAGQRSIP